MKSGIINFDSFLKKTISFILVSLMIIRFLHFIYFVRALWEEKKNQIWALSKFNAKAVRSGIQNTDLYHHKQLTTRDIWPTGLILSNKWSRNQWFISSNICLRSIIIPFSDIKNTFFSLNIKIAGLCCQEKRSWLNEWAQEEKLNFGHEITIAVIFTSSFLNSF